MPKSKRNKIGAFAVCYSPSTTTSRSHCLAAWLLASIATVSLTQTKKRPKERKEALVTNVRDAANQYQSIYVFKVANMRNVYLQEVRRRWHDSRFVRRQPPHMTQVP